MERLLTAQITPTVSITGCFAASCTQQVKQTDAFATEVPLGSPLLLSQVGFKYATIDCQRTEAQGSTTFGWNVAMSKPL